jgi:uncharacterized protein YbaP (TraB family)
VTVTDERLAALEHTIQTAIADANQLAVESTDGMEAAQLKLSAQKLRTADLLVSAMLQTRCEKEQQQQVVKLRQPFAGLHLVNGGAA